MCWGTLLKYRVNPTGIDRPDTHISFELCVVERSHRLDNFKCNEEGRFRVRSTKGCIDLVELITGGGADKDSRISEDFDYIDNEQCSNYKED